MELIDEARRLDPDRTLAVLFAAPEDRLLLAALVLFNAELARIPEVVREPMAGMIRYQWWRDAVAAAAAGRDTGQHPLLAPLSHGLRAGRVDEAALEALIEDREGELDRLQPADLEALDAYALATSGALHAMLARACVDDAWTISAAKRVGAGFALVGLVRAIGFHQRQGRIMLPVELVERHAIDTADILAARNEEALARATAAILARAREHLDAAAAAGPFPRRAMPALLPARLARRQARLLERAGPMAAAAPSRDAWTVPSLFWRYLTRRI
jgi:NADH dehydrogenase [ubiquinone] 1 alpha subcomplex assembly factor 6